MGAIRIERILKRKSGYEAVLNDGSSIEMNEDQLVRWGLYKGMELRDEQVRDIRKSSSDHQAYNAALRLLGHRPRTAKELERRLADKQFAPEAIANALERLTRERYVNDEEYAAVYTDEKLNMHGKGRHWIKQQLLSKGIDPAVVDETLRSIPSDGERDKALALARKRWALRKPNEDRRKSLNKVGQYLQRRGFSIDTIRFALGQLDNFNEDEY